MSTSKRLSVSLIFPEYWLRTHPLRTITFQAFGIGSLSLLCAGVIQSSVQASSFNIDEIYVFGDSNVDIGRVYQATGGAFPPAPLYAEGRFTNGPVWVEYLAQSLGLTVNAATNFAFGGANTGTLNTINPSWPGVLTQVNQYLNSVTVADPRGLYIIAAGANDYLFGGITEPVEAVNNLEISIRALVGMGGNQIMVSNLFDLGKVPLVQGTGREAALNHFTTEHRDLLFTRINHLQTTFGSRVKIKTLDFWDSFNQLQANPARFGFSNVTEPCLVTNPVMSVCSDPDSYFFWDQLHPSTAGQRAIAAVAQSSLQSTPEPATGGAIFFVSALAFIGRMIRKNP
jgi:phospholipase/lecithinase/hemolysin